MDASEFRRILTTFADEPADVNLTKGTLTIQVRDTIIEANLSQKEGLLWVREGDTEILAQHWLTNRIARLPILADRILAYVPGEPSFVSPRGDFIDRAEKAPGELPEPSDDVVGTLRTLLGEKPAGTTTVLYLTSEAGEGKTTVIREAARRQAEQFKNKQTDWLLIPIPLGGRPFLRLDDVTVSALVNGLRFPFLYFQAFLELVRMGVIVPALDGFEELLVQDAAGEGVSALGQLIQSLNSSGSLLVAARKAYFEYKSFETQSKLFDSLGAASVSFAKLGLVRWDESRFIKYGQLRQVSKIQQIYDAVSERLTPEHPLLTRAVLVGHLLDVASGKDDLGELLSHIQGPTDDFFEHFIDAIVKREASQKWIARGEVTASLLTVAEHHHLLALVAQEMWISKCDSLRKDVLEVIADIFSDLAKKGPAVQRQIFDRLPDHALLSRQPDSTYAFDHQAFRNYFLGEAIGRAMQEGPESDIRSLLRIGPLPSEAIQTATSWLKRRTSDARAIVAKLEQACQSDGPGSHTRENGADLIARLIDGSVRSIEISNLSFGSDALTGRAFTEITFRHCFFQPTSMRGTSMVSCVFENCEFNHIELHGSTSIQDCRIIDSQILGITLVDGSTIFEPVQMSAQLEKSGFLSERISARFAQAVETHDDVTVTMRALRAFLRNTEVNEGVFRSKLGTRYGDFERKLLPRLVKKGVLVEIGYQGGGQQRRFKLGVKMNRLERAEVESGSSFEGFLAEVAT